MFSSLDYHRCAEKARIIRDAQLAGLDEAWRLINGTEPPAESENPIAPPCRSCGGPHPFDTSVPSEAWNRVIKGRGLPDYLCLSCIVQAFAAAGEGFTAKLFGPGLPDHYHLRGQMSGGGIATREKIESTTSRQQADA
jgi:hypothetical protein